MSDDQTPTFEGWAFLELMGHRRLAGYLTEVTLAGSAFVRIDVPDPDGGDQARATQFYAPGAVYCITPTTEELALQFSRKAQPAPVSRWELERPKTIDVDGTDYGDDEF